MIDVLPEFAACGAPRVAPLLGIALTHGRAFEQQVVGAAGSIAASGFLESPAPITRRKEEDTRKARNAFAVAAVLGVGIAIGSYLADSENSVIPAANAAGGEVDSPVGVAPDRYVYYPGTEEIGKDEIRLIAAGTGMPRVRGAVRPRPASWSSSETGRSSSSTSAPAPCATSRR
jgi:hypothetical protein